jgi:hypothetical protein
MRGPGLGGAQGGRAVAVASIERSRRGGPKRTPVRAQLPATQTADRRNHNVPQSGPSTRRDDDARRLRRGRRPGFDLGVAGGSAWSIGFSEIQPAHRTPQSTAQDEMGSAGSSMPGAPRRYSAGNARCTRAPTESGDPHVPLAVAMVTAVPQLGIERVEHVGVKSGHLDRPDRRQDMPVDLPLVRTPRVRLDDRLAGGPPAAGATAVGPGAGARTPGRPSALTAHRTVPCARVDDKVALERAPDHLPAPTRRMFWHSVVHGRTARHEVGGAGAGLASRRDDDPGNRSGKSAGKGRSSS